jgi:Fe2+ transport system protein B
MPPEYATTRELDAVIARNGILEKRILKAADDSREDARETRDSLALLTKSINEAIVHMTSCTGQIVANEKATNDLKQSVADNLSDIEKDVKYIQDERTAEAKEASEKATKKAEDETAEVKSKWKAFLNKHWAVLLMLAAWLLSLIG